MNSPTLQEGKTSSEYRITQVVVAAGIIIQVTEELLTYKKNKELSATTLKDSSPDQVMYLLQDIGGVSYIGGILSIVVTLAYIVKRALLKYLAMKGQVQLEIEKIKAELKSAQHSRRKTDTSQIENNSPDVF